jgi:DNA-K related protein/Hsp70 protein
MSDSYCVGIDLGTTNSSVGYCSGDASVKLFSIPQFVQAGRLGGLLTLPSFLYQGAAGEFPAGSFRLPWAAEESLSLVGEFARDQGERVPSRLIASAKSWLCHATAVREEAILPIESAEEAIRLSPVAASAAFLRHIRDAWNYHHPTQLLEEQEVVVTVPASFDEVARRLTLEAARLAGLEGISLLEEPQAAFYSWMMDHRRGELPPGSVVLVCDVGGGTTDFSLIEVEEGGSFRRMAVGDHLLLGGDNFDTALCHLVEQQLGELEPSHWLKLRHQARRCKEEIMGGGDHFLFHLEGSGSRLVGGSRTVRVEGEEVRRLLLDGFFGRFSLKEASQRRRGGGLRSMGLPYEAEPSIVKQMAAFLERAGARPSHLLFNGGSMRPKPFQQAIVANLTDWYGEVKTLSTDHLETAVCRGAAHYLRLGRSGEQRIGGGIARGYYLGLGDQALTLLPRGSEEGTTYRSDRPFSLKTNAPITFQLYSSSTRLTDQAGDLVTIDPDHFLPLAPIATLLRFGKGGDRKIAVDLSLELTALGTLNLWLESRESSHRWKLEFGVREAATRTRRLEVDETYEPEVVQEAATRLIESWRAGSDNPLRLLEEHLGQRRESWSLSLLRTLCDAVLSCAEERKRSIKLEARWWHLVGYLLRPGCGSALDPFRIRQVWQAILADGTRERDRDVELHRTICYRRIAAGLGQGQQRQLGAALDVISGKKLLNDSNFMLERLRTLASFERLQLQMKQRLGDDLVSKVVSGAAGPVEYWALGRIGGRQLLYGSVGHVVPRLICAGWVERLLAKGGGERLPALLTQLGRQVDQRELNLPVSLVEAVLRRYDLKPLREMVGVSREEEEERLGEALPYGLELLS